MPQAPAPDTEPHPPLHTNRHLLWTGSSYGVTSVLNLALVYLLSWWLPPAQMAVIFVAIIFQDLILLVIDTGMASFVVQEAAMNEREQSSLFYLGLVVSVLLALLISGMAPWITRFANVPGLTGALRITALSFIAIAFSFPQKALFQKDLRFKTIAIIEMIGMIIGAGLTLFLVARGFGVASYMIGFLARKLTESILVWIRKPWMPTPALDKVLFRKITTYCAFGSNALVLSYATRLVETMIVGRFLGASVLGIYSMASNLVFFPITKTVIVFSRVYVSTFSKLKNETEKLATVFSEALRKLVMLLCPGLIFLGIGVNGLLALFFAPRWAPVGDLVPIMIVGGLLLGFLRLGEPMLFALNKPQAVFKIHGLTLILTSLLIIALVHTGMVGVACGSALGSVVPVFLMARVLKSLNVLPAPKITRGMAPTLWVLSGLGVVLGAVHLWLEPLWGEKLTVAISGCLMLAAYAALWLNARPEGISAANISV